MEQLHFWTGCAQNIVKATKKKKSEDEADCFYRLKSLTARLLRLLKNTYLYQINSIFQTGHIQSIVKMRNKVCEVQVATAK